jgi:AmiR/NasT family two-component response regulator
MRALIVTINLLTRSRLQEAASAAGYEAITQRHVPPVPEPSDSNSAPDIMVVDLDIPGALAGAVHWRQAYPELRLVGFAYHVEDELIRQAREAGIEVLPHGATARPNRIFS